ncbi:cytochrome P450 [Phanerochaete sordida]|uniref:Cytochrome P450 n=1 Tax=Phanerochaete sordida TaxID=48140 RepID=A0A9P3GN29_9APHY|nr:cytochrome P450 [Phanerochaete sordida]
MVSIVILALLASLALVLRVKRKRYNTPPGPKGLPIVGNAWDIPKSFEWMTYAKWGRDYSSDIIYLRIFGTDVIVLNSAKAADDLLNRRSNIYSDREYMVMLLDLVGWGGRHFAFQRYGDLWRAHRRLFHQYFHPAAVPAYYDKETQEARKLLPRLLEHPDDYMQEIRTMTASIILGIVFGMELQPNSDPYVAMAEKALNGMASVGNVGSYMVDYLPWLKYVPSWVPGAGFQRSAAEWRAATLGMYDKPFQSIKHAMASGKAPPSILTTMLSKLDPDEDNSTRENDMRHVTGTAYAAGADTTVSSLGTFLLAMVMYPDIQKRAQEEIDRVVGSDRFPSIEDKDELPYITATMNETLRWRQVTPLGVAHKLRVDDEYNGYHLPAGSIVVGNSWAILHDEERYPNPDVFDPTRYLTPDGELNKDMPDPEPAFGFGRRICPGRYFAMDSMWIAMAHILATLNVEKAVDAAGNVIEPSGEYTSGLLSYPVPFKVSFKPRSASALALIQPGTSVE